MSKMTMREKARNRGMAATMATARAAVRRPYSRRAKAHTRSRSARPNSAEGRRAAASLVPKASKERATALK